MYHRLRPVSSFARGRERLLLRRACTLIFTLALAGASSSCHRADRRLLGSWISVSRGAGNVATVLEFRSNGTVYSAYESLADYAYQAGNNLLLLSFTDPKTGLKTDQSFEMHLSGSSLILSTPLEGSKQRFKRVGAAGPGAPSLVGEWESDPPGDQPTFMKFASGGKVSIRHVLRGREERYTISGDKLTVTSPGAPPQPGTYRFEGAQLVLVPQGGGELRYERLQ